MTPASPAQAASALWTLPRLKSIHISKVGIIEVLRLDLSPGLNILTGPCGSGKSTVLRSVVAAVTGAFPDGSRDLENENSRVLVELGASSCVSEPGHCDIPEWSSSRATGSCPSVGHEAMRDLNAALGRSRADSLVMVEDEITGPLDHVQFHAALGMLVASPAQKLIVLGASKVPDLEGMSYRKFTMPGTWMVTSCLVEDASES